MIRNCTTSSGQHYVDVMWNRPKYHPERYELYYSCKLLRGDYYYIDSKLDSLKSTASIDPGLTVTADTLATKSSRKLTLTLICILTFNV